MEAVGLTRQRPQAGKLATNFACFFLRKGFNIRAMFVRCHAQSADFYSVNDNFKENTYKSGSYKKKRGICCMPNLSGRHYLCKGSNAPTSVISCADIRTSHALFHCETERWPYTVNRVPPPPRPISRLEHTIQCDKRLLTD